MGMAKRTKRMVAVILAVIMVVAGIPFTPSVKAAGETEGKTNLALNKTVYFSSEEGTSNTGVNTSAQNAVDGKEDTCWTAQARNLEGTWISKYPEWLCVDLGNEYDLSTVKLMFEKKDGKRYYGYNIYTSNTAPTSETESIPETFTKIVDKENNTTVTDNIFIEDAVSGKARYVLIEVVSCSQYDASTKYQAASIYELQAYGSGAEGSGSEATPTPDTGDQEEKDYGIQTASGRDGTYAQELDGTWKFGGENLSEDAALKADYSNWTNVTVPIHGMQRMVKMAAAIIREPNTGTTGIWMSQKPCWQKGSI